MKPWRIVVRDTSETRRAQLRGYTDATFIPKFRDIGSWAVQIPSGAPGTEYITQGCGIIAYRGNEQILSGPMRVYKESWNSDRKTPVINLAGVTDEFVVGTHVAYPTPTVAATGQTVTATRRLTGSLETVVKTILRENLLPTSAVVSFRSVSNFQIAQDQNRGPAVAVSLRFDNLLIWLQMMLATAGYGFRVTYNPQDKYEFDITVPRDLSSSIKFSRDRRNLAAYDYALEAPQMTYGIIGGSGVGTARAFITGQRTPIPDPWGYFVEQFIDRRDTSDNAEMNQELTDMLVNTAGPQSFRFAVMDTPELQFGRDYLLGDRVSVGVRGTTFSDTVNAVQYELREGRERVTPTIGDFDTNQLKVFSTVAKLARRVGLLERRT